MNTAAEAVLAALQDGPKSTIELQALCPTTHAAKPVFDLRQDGWIVTRKSLPNRVALYTLVGRMPDVPEGAEVIPPASAPSRASRPPVEFGNPASVLAYGRGRR